MEKLQKTLPEARLVKAFNSVGNALMYKPDFNNQLPTMFICGNDASEKNGHGKLEKFGWEMEDMGQWKLQGQLSHYAYYGVLPDLLKMTGIMHSNY